MVPPQHTHTNSREEGTTTPILPQETEKICYGSSDPQRVLWLHHREHPGCITAWYGNCSASDHKVLQRVVRMAQYINGAKLYAIQDLYNIQCQRKALKTVYESSHPSQTVLSATTWQAVPERQA